MEWQGVVAPPAVQGICLKASQNLGAYTAVLPGITGTPCTAETTTRLHLKWNFVEAASTLLQAKNRFHRAAFLFSLLCMCLDSRVAQLKALAKGNQGLAEGTSHRKSAFCMACIALLTVPSAQS